MNYVVLAQSLRRNGLNSTITQWVIVRETIDASGRDITLREAHSLADDFAMDFHHVAIYELGPRIWKSDRPLEH